MSTKNDFPTTLEGFGYEFVDGRLQSIETGEPFEFKARANDEKYNQKRYEAICEVITEHVYDQLEAAGLLRITIPIDASSEEPKSFIFATDQQKKHLVVIIHGSGAVRAGQWSRRLIMNDSLDWGTVLPFIRCAFDRDCDVCVMNTNLNEAPTQSTRSGLGRVRESENPISHAEYVWQNFVQPSNAEHVTLIAHSAGGYVVRHLAKAFASDFSERVIAVCFTDAAYSGPSDATVEWWERLCEIGRDWIVSDEPLDTPIKNRSPRVPRVSAGTTVHERTSYSAIDSIWRFIDEKCGSEHNAVLGDTTESTEVVVEEEENETVETFHDTEHTNSDDDDHDESGCSGTDEFVAASAAVGEHKEDEPNSALDSAHDSFEVPEFDSSDDLATHNSSADRIENHAENGTDNHNQATDIGQLYPELQVNGGGDRSQTDGHQDPNMQQPTEKKPRLEPGLDDNIPGAQSASNNSEAIEENPIFLQ